MYSSIFRGLLSLTLLTTTLCHPVIQENTSLILRQQSTCGSSFDCPAGYCCSKNFGSIKWGYCRTGHAWCEGTDRPDAGGDPSSQLSSGGGSCKALKDCPTGMCCSKWGYCGIGDDYCKDAIGAREPVPCNSSKDCAPGTCCSKKFGTGICETGDGYCGGPIVARDGGSCKGIGDCPKGFCCSQYGYCGTGAEYCTHTYVAINPGSQPSPGSASGGTDPNGKCGRDNGGKSCPPGTCCSKYGYCGSTPDYCPFG